MKKRHFIGILLLIELLDELIGSGMDAAWPLIKSELNLSYSEIGLCMGLPAFLSGIVDPFTSLLGDTGRRRTVVLFGGLAFSSALLLRGASSSFSLLLLSLILFYPASGAFVNLSQATLMDLEPRKREINMARWTFLGSSGMVAGPLILGGLLFAGWSWRHLFIITACLSLPIVLWQCRIVTPHENTPISLRRAFAGMIDALKSRYMLRWLMLIQAGDLMLDVLMAFLALYFVEIGKVTPIQAGLAVSVWTGVGLVGDFLLIPLLSRIKGLTYLRVSSGIVAILFPLFLLVPDFWIKLVLVGLLGFFNSGWYAILQAQIYESFPGRSGTALAIYNVSCIAGGMVPLILGIIAEALGLSVAMWLLLLGPLALLTGLRRRQTAQS